MLLENFEEVKDLVKQIKDLQQILDSIKTEPKVIIATRYGSFIETIEINADAEHIHKHLAEKLIDEIISDLELRTSNLKEKLKQL